MRYAFFDGSGTAKEAAAEVRELEVDALQIVEGLREDPGMGPAARVVGLHLRYRRLRDQVAGVLPPQLLVDGQVEEEERRDVRRLALTQEAAVDRAQLRCPRSPHELVHQQVEEEVGQRLLEAGDEPPLHHFQRGGEPERVGKADVVPDLVGEDGGQAGGGSHLGEQRQIDNHLPGLEVDVGERLVAAPVRARAPLVRLRRAQAHLHIPDGERVGPGLGQVHGRRQRVRRRCRPHVVAGAGAHRVRFRDK